MTNADIATRFQSIAEILAIRGENPFRIRAYERAAVTIGGFPQEVSDVFRRGGTEALEEIPGIGVDLAEKIAELVTRGQLRFYDALARELPPGLLAVMSVEGMGPKRTKFVWKEFGVRNVRDLERLARSGELTRVRGWGDRSVASILQAIDMRRKFGRRLPLGVALPIAESLVASLEATGQCDQVAIAGSIRRRRETIGDVDLLVTSVRPKRVIDQFCASSLVQRVIAKGTTKANVLLRAGIEADLRVLAPEVFGAGLYYFTGSKQHNVRTRIMAIQKGMTINEYGVFRGTKAQKGKRVACRAEEDVFRAIGLPYIPPEIREDTGEIEAALRGELPTLLEDADIRGDLHAHSDVSDGSATMEEMIAAAKRAGLAYVCISDHASIMGMVRGVNTWNGAHGTENASMQRRSRGVSVVEYVKRVRAAAAKVPGMHVLVGIEVDILADGRLYLPDAALRKFDWVIGSIHQSFKQSEAAVTARYLRAMENPHLSCIGHPSTRIIGRRGALSVDWDAVFRAASARGVAMELNAAWDRLDLDDVRCRQAKAAGVKIAVNSDAHATTAFVFRYGVSQARRGWLERADVVNAMPWAAFERWRKRRR